MRLEELNLSNARHEQTRAFCPLCHSSRKRHKHERSLSVNTLTGAFYCHHCAATGVLEGFEGSYMATDFANKEERKYAAPNQEELEKQSIELNEKVLTYFKNRGISEDTIRNFGLTYGPSFYRRTDEGRIVKENDIPIVDRAIRYPFYEKGKLVNVKHILPKEWAHDGERQFKSFTDAKPVPFNLDRASDYIYALSFDKGSHTRLKEPLYLVITEGEIDALSVEQAGMKCVISVPNGSKSLHWLEFPSIVNLLQSVQTVYLAGDSDEDGQRMHEELVRRLSILIGPEKLRLVTWPDDCKDANDTLVKYGPEVVESCIVTLSQTVPIEGISEISEFREEFLDFYNNGVPRGVSTGLKSLDPLYRVMPGMLTVITGITNHGKSELLDEIVRRMAEELDWKFAYYTPENYPMSLHMIKLAEKHIGKPFDITRDGAMNPEEVNIALSWMNDHVFYINPRGSVYSPEEIIQRAKVLIYRKGINGLIIDPWNHVRKDFGPLREDQFINESLQKLGAFTKETGLHIWLVVHPRTLRRDMKSGKVAPPTIHDLSGGSKFGDNADFVFSVARDPLLAQQTRRHEVTVHVQKARYRYAGTQGNVKLLWEPFSGRFQDIEEAVIKKIGVPEESNGTNYETINPDDEF